MEKSYKKRVLFYYLQAFSATGGIEKFNRCFIKALSELQGISPEAISVYESGIDSRYGQDIPFKGFSEHRSKSVLYVIKTALRSDVLIIGHINLSVAGVIAKLLNPKCQLIVIAHGIEVWGKLRGFKKWCLDKADMVLAVSNYTKNQLVLRNGVNSGKIRLFPNTIDPFFAVPAKFGKPGYLLERYGLNQKQPIILTLSRLSFSEGKKGYDKMIEALPYILKEFPDAVYILAGKYDATEFERINQLAEKHKVKDNLILTDFIIDEEVPDHYMLADVFIMPSRKEGFGIVFLEALACGTNVIGGNQDGTVDALHNGSLGKLINPSKISEIVEAVKEQLHNNNSQPGKIQQKVLDMYRFVRYKKRLENYIA